MDAQDEEKDALTRMDRQCEPTDSRTASSDGGDASNNQTTSVIGAPRHRMSSMVALAAAMSGLSGRPGDMAALQHIAKGATGNRYMPHQGERERARRLKALRGIREAKRHDEGSQVVE